MKKAIYAATAMTMVGASAGVDAAGAAPAPATHRYLIERTFPAGALDGVDATVKQKVNANNSRLGVTWEKSYMNPDKTRTYCVYRGPSEAAVRGAAELNGLPVDSVTAIPDDIKSEPRGAVHTIGKGLHRYLVKRTGNIPLRAHSDLRFGVTVLTSYGTADGRASYWVYEAPDIASVERAIKASGNGFDSIVEIPETLYPY